MITIMDEVITVSEKTYKKLLDWYHRQVKNG